jgi:hypothetical protein
MRRRTSCRYVKCVCVCVCVSVWWMDVSVRVFIGGEGMTEVRARMWGCSVCMCVSHANATKPTITHPIHC